MASSIMLGEQRWESTSSVVMCASACCTSELDVRLVLNCKIDLSRAEEYTARLCCKLITWVGVQA